MVSGPEFDEFEEDRHWIISTVVYFVFLMVMSVVVLNFIIAIQGDTYGKQKDKDAEIYARHILELRSVHGV